MISIGASAFSNCSNLIIFTNLKEIEVYAKKWGNNWNNDRPVYYAGEWHIDTDGVPTIGAIPVK